MSISYSGSDVSMSTAPRAAWRLVRTVMIVDALFAAACVSWWSTLSGVIGEPIKWATGQGLTDDPGLLEYPFVLCWLPSVAGIACAWLMHRLGRNTAALGCALAPIAFVGLLIGWFYLAPVQWR